MGDVHGVGGRGDGRAARRAQHVAHEGREGALLLAAGRLAVPGAIALVAVAVARALGARWRGIHLAGELLEGRRLAEAGGLFEARGLAVAVGAVDRLRVDGAGRAQLLGGVGGGVGAGDDVGERVAYQFVLRGQPARGRVVEAVCAARIDGAALGQRRQQRGRAAEAAGRRGRVAVARGGRDAKAARVPGTLKVRGCTGSAFKRRGRVVFVIIRNGRASRFACLLGQPPVGRLAVSVAAFVHGWGCSWSWSWLLVGAAVLHPWALSVVQRRPVLRKPAADRCRASPANRGAPAAARRWACEGSGQTVILGSGWKNWLESTVEEQPAQILTTPCGPAQTANSRRRLGGILASVAPYLLRASPRAEWLLLSSPHNVKMSFT